MRFLYSRTTTRRRALLTSYISFRNITVFKQICLCYSVLCSAHSLFVNVKWHLRNDKSHYHGDLTGDGAVAGCVGARGVAPSNAPVCSGVSMVQLCHATTTYELRHLTFCTRLDLYCSVSARYQCFSNGISIAIYSFTSPPTERFGFGHPLDPLSLIYYLELADIYKYWLICV